MELLEFTEKEFDKLLKEDFDYLVKVSDTNQSAVNMVIHLYAFKELSEALAFQATFPKAETISVHRILDDFEGWETLAQGVDLLEAYIFFPE